MRSLLLVLLHLTTAAAEAESVEDIEGQCVWGDSHLKDFSPEPCGYDPADISPYAAFMKNADEVKEETVMTVKFVNTLPEIILKYWDDGSPKGRYQGQIYIDTDEVSGTYASHSFFFTTKSGEEVARFKMVPGEEFYIIHGNRKEIMESEKYLKKMKEIDFQIEYQKRTGHPWLSAVIPREAPIDPIWPALFPGQEHKIESDYGYWDFEGDKEGEGLDITLKVLAVSPKVFLIENLLSKEECELIYTLGKSEVSKSKLGQEGFADDSRSSETGWIPRQKHKVVDYIFSRFADVLNIDETRLKTGGIAEPLQVVHYGKGGHYHNHYDFFSSHGKKNVRFATLFIYLRPAEKGGGTGFPKAMGGRGLSVTPPAGTAILFYNSLEDGNSDHMAEHTGLHVIEGEKWATNLWIWDPSLRYN